MILSHPGAVPKSIDILGKPPATRLSLKTPYLRYVENGLSRAGFSVLVAPKWD